MVYWFIYLPLSEQWLTHRIRRRVIFSVTAKWCYDLPYKMVYLMKNTDLPSKGLKLRDARLSYHYFKLGVIITSNSVTRIFLTSRQISWYYGILPSLCITPTELIPSSELASYLTLNQWYVWYDKACSPESPYLPLQATMNEGTIVIYWWITGAHCLACLAGNFRIHGSSRL